jgi:hypothetical protein
MGDCTQFTRWFKMIYIFDPPRFWLDSTFNMLIIFITVSCKSQFVHFRPLHLVSLLTLFIFFQDSSKTNCSTEECYSPCLYV